MFFEIEITEDGPAISGLTRQGREARIMLRLEGNQTRFDISVEPLPGIFDDDDRAVDIEVSRVTSEHISIASRLEAKFGSDLTSLDDSELIAGAASILSGEDIDATDIEQMIARLNQAPQLTA